MSKHRKKLSGVFPPIMTPFVNEDVAYARLSENIERYNQTELRGYMPLGSNGEFRSLTDEESVKVVEVVSKKKAADKTLIVGVGRESARATIEFIKKIADLGVDYVSVLPPHYFVSYMTETALIKHYATVAESSPIPVMVYNAPQFASGLLIPPAVVSVLARHPNIVGMKDTSKEEISVYIDVVPEGAEFYVLAGTINKFFDGLPAGAVGGVLSIANYLPEKCCELQKIFESGDLKEGRKMDEYLRSLSSKAAGKYGVAGVKAAMDLRGYYGGDPRIPLLPLKDEQKAELARVLQEEGLL